MHRTGHVGAALLAFGPVGFVAGAVGGADPALLGGGVAVALASVPDIDMRLPLVAHRGPTHTAWFALLVGAGVGALGVLAGLDSGLLVAAGAGLFGFVTGAVAIGSHIAADALTPMGIRPFTPFSDRTYTLNLVRAANPLANYALLVAGGVVGVGLSVLGVYLHRAI